MAKTLAEQIAALTPSQQAKYYSGAYGFGAKGVKNVKANTSIAGKAGPVTQITPEQASTHVGATPLGPQNIQLLPGLSVAPTDEEADQPPKPTVPPGLAEQGWDYIWNQDTETWDLEQGAADDTAADNDLFEEWRSALAQFGFQGTEVDEFLAQGLREGWTTSTRVIKMRQQSWYLANPLFSANLERSRQGKRFLSEQEVLDHAANVRSLVKQFGYSDVPDSYIAASLISKASDPSQILAQMNHQLAVHERVKQFGGGVAIRYREILGRDPSDQDLYELFDPTIDTQDVDDALRMAEYQGRPLTLGLGIRNEAEARAFEMLGISPDEAFSRYEGLAQNASRFERLRSIEDLISKGLPDSFGSFVQDLPNDFIRDAFLYQTPEALAKLQTIAAREMSRFRQGTVQAQQGQLTGLLSNEQVQSFG